MKTGNILIVDDEKNIRFLLKHILEPVGYTVSEAENGEIASDLMMSEDFDIVITDIHMPKVGGLEVLFSTHDKENPPEVIVISGGGRDLSYYFEEASMLGAAHTIQKPFSTRDILDAVDEALISRRTS